MEDLEVLIICSVCEKIKIEEMNSWMSKVDNSELYDKFREKYKDRLSHGYCPRCYEEAMEKLTKE